VTTASPRLYAKDDCLVLTGPLALLVEGFITARGQTCDGDPVAWLAQRTRDADPGRDGISTARITRVLRRERQHTELNVADVLLVAIGRVDALYDGTVPIIPNPARPGCCHTYDYDLVAYP
jgi:hypothetical protein